MGELRPAFPRWSVYLGFHHVELATGLSHSGNKADSLAVLLTRRSNAHEAAKRRHAPDASRISHSKTSGVVQCLFCRDEPLPRLRHSPDERSRSPECADRWRGKPAVSFRAIYDRLDRLHPEIGP